MLHTDTCLILGAGASKDLGMPLGSELVSEIRNRAEADVRRHDPWNYAPTGLLRLMPKPLNEKQAQALGQAVQTLHEGALQFSSIDDFLEYHGRDDAVVSLGKTAIAQCIMEREGTSLLKPKPGFNPPAPILEGPINDTWLPTFFRSLIAGSSPDTIFDRLRIVSFNYDRTVEYYLYHALKRAFALADDDARAALSHLKIFHPYGSLGKISELGRPPAVPFGTGATASDVAASIRTYSEQISDLGLQTQIHEAMRWARRIVFLGFGFHQQNMKLLAPQDGMDPKPMYASAMGFFEEDRPGLVERLAMLLPLDKRNIFASNNFGHLGIDRDCCVFFKAYKTTLFN